MAKPDIATVKIIRGVYLNPTIISKSNFKKNKKNFQSPFVFKNIIIAQISKKHLPSILLYLIFFLILFLIPLGTDKNTC